MYCSKCGKELSEDSRFCDACGASVAKSYWGIQIDKEELKKSAEGLLDDTVKSANTAYSFARDKSKEAYAYAKDKSKEAYGFAKEKANQMIDDYKESRSESKDINTDRQSSGQEDDNNYPYANTRSDSDFQRNKYERKKLTFIPVLVVIALLFVGLFVISRTSIGGDLPSALKPVVHVCKAEGCDETDLYDDGYCKYHYYKNFGQNAIDEWGFDREDQDDLMDYIDEDGTLEDILKNEVNDK